MVEQVETCSRCFTLKGKGFFRRLFLKRKLKAAGHLIFDEKKNDNGTWLLIVSTRLYPGATFKNA